MKRKNQFTDYKGRPKLKASYCVFMDVLGFHNLINPNEKHRDAQKKFSWFYGVMVDRLNALNDKEIPVDQSIVWNIKIFTDNIILGRVLNVYKMTWQFWNLFKVVAEYQLMMALEGLFVRGGLSVGDLFMDENIVYGPALIEAHRIESEIACYPRIVLSDIARGNFEVQMVLEEMRGNRSINNLILIDSDGHGFLNYLLVIINQESLTPNWVFLEKHKDVIERNLSVHRRNIKIWTKYLWVANYHNFFCSFLREFEGFNPRFLVSDDFTRQRIQRANQDNIWPRGKKR